jgi:hypothetical protein
MSRFLNALTSRKNAPVVVYLPERSPIRLDQRRGRQGARPRRDRETRSRALALASEAAQVDLAATMHTSADPWLDQLDRQINEARQRGLDVIDQLVQSARDIGAAAAAAAWVRSGEADGRWDRRPQMMMLGSVAPSSARVTITRSRSHSTR